MDHGFETEFRLLTSAQFKIVFDGATRKTSGACVLLLARPNELGHPRLGLVIAKKSVRRAVDRNRVKRIARESFRLNKSKLGTLDIVVLARKGLGELDNAALHEMYQGMWRKLAKSADKPPRSRQSGPPSSNA